MSTTEKKINKRLVGLVIGTAIIGAGSMTPKGKSFWKRMMERAQSRGEFFAGGVKEIKKNMKDTTKNDTKDIVKE